MASIGLCSIGDNNCLAGSFCPAVNTTVVLCQSCSSSIQENQGCNCKLGIQTTNCIACKNGKCSQCRNLFTVNDEICVECIENCKSCLSPGVCSICDDKYQLIENQCIKSQFCSTDADCTEQKICDKVGKVCGSCTPNCDQCYPQLGFQCKACQDGYVFNGNKCSKTCFQEKDCMNLAICPTGSAICIKPVEKGNTPTGGAIAGIVVAVIILIAIVVGLSYYIVKKGECKKDKEEDIIQLATIFSR